MQTSLTLNTINVAVIDVLNDPLVRARTDQPLLRLRERTGLVRITHPRLLPTRPQRLQRNDHQLQRLITTTTDKLLMETTRRHRELIRIIDHLQRLRMQLPQTRQHRLITVLTRSTDTRTDRLDVLQRITQIRQLNTLRLQHQTHRVPRIAHPRHMHRGTTTVTTMNSDQTLRLQNPQRLTKRRAAHPK